MDYKQVAKDILQHIGGKENIAHLGHCSTRLRFSLVDDKKADIKALESTPGVIAVRMTAQCQVVIGNDVVEVYEELQKLVGDAGGEEAAAQPKEKKKSALRFLISSSVYSSRSYQQLPAVVS